LKRIIYSIAIVVLSAFSAFALNFNFSAEGPTVHGPDPQFTSEYSAVARIANNSSVTNTTYRDLTQYSMNDADYFTEGQVKGYQALDATRDLGGFIYTSLDPDIATVDANGNVTYVSAGTARIMVQPVNYERYYKQIVSVPVSYNEGSVYDLFIDFGEGSFGRYCADGFENRTSNTTADNYLSRRAIFSTRNHATSTYVRNADCWAQDLDITCVPVYSTPTGRRNGCLISPQHLIFATHYQYAVNDTIRFVAPDNTIVTRILTAKQSLPQSGYYPDITVGVLNSTVPETISYAKVINGTSWDDTYAPGTHMGEDYLKWGLLPMLWVSQDDYALVQVPYKFDLGEPETGYILWMINKIYTARPYYYRSEVRKYLENDIRGGDSGSARFLIFGDDLVLLSLTTGGNGAGSHVSGFIAEINALMTSLGGEYQLSEVDLSGFNNYAEE